jgi:hypothetical protein
MFSMGHANRVVGYLASVAAASLFYVAWLALSFMFVGPSRGQVKVLFNIGLAIFFWSFEGMGAALALMALPWCLAVRAYARVRTSGWIYFPVIGAATTLVIGCGTSSLAPKPLFIEDQTFFEGFMVAAERQGICLLLTGLVFGFTFWTVSERLRPSHQPFIDS